MTERLHDNAPETVVSPEALERQRENLSKLQEAAQNAERQQAGKDIEALQKTVETYAISGKEVSVVERESPQTQSFGVERSLKADAYRRMLQKTRRQLNIPDRALSKIVHQPAVEAISNIASKTVARPSGVLGGGTVALIGSAWLLYAAKHIGFTYNYLVFFGLIILGFIAGLIIELVYRISARIRS